MIEMVYKMATITVKLMSGKVISIDVFNGFTIANLRAYVETIVNLENGEAVDCDRIRLYDSQFELIYPSQDHLYVTNESHFYVVVLDSVENDPDYYDYVEEYYEME